MITDQNIGSARAEKHNNPAARHVVRRLLTALLASALAMPSLATWGLDTSPRTAEARTSDILPLPPIPYLDSIPWMKWNAAAPMMKIDTLMAPSITPWGILQTPQDRAQARPTFS